MSEHKEGILSDEGVCRIEDASLKEQIAETVLKDLPEWFGLPDSTKEYVEKVEICPFSHIIWTGTMSVSLY